MSDFIRKMINQGRTNEEIRQELLRYGITEERIDRAFEEYIKEEEQNAKPHFQFGINT